MPRTRDLGIRNVEAARWPDLERPRCTAAIFEEQRDSNVGHGVRRIGNQPIGLVADIESCAALGECPERAGLRRAARCVRLVPTLGDVAGPPHRPFSDEGHTIGRFKDRRDGCVLQKRIGMINPDAEPAAWRHDIRWR